MKRILAALSIIFILPGYQGTLLADNSEKLILVSGATGTQGGAVVQALLEKGFPVRAMTRNPGSERAAELIRLGIEIVQADFNDIPSLDRALNGVYGAFSVQQWRNIGTDAEIRQGSDFADAAQRAGVRHFVYTSNAAAAENTGIPHFDSKFAIEEHIRSIKIPYTILGPRGFMTDIRGDYEDGVRRGVIEGVMEPDKPVQFIAPRDIGRFAAEAFENPETWIGRQVGIAGDEMTMPELAALFSELTDREISYRQIPWKEFVARFTPEALKVPSWYRTSTFHVDIEGLREEFPWMLTVREFLAGSDWLRP